MVQSSTAAVSDAGVAAADAPEHDGRTLFSPIGVCLHSEYPLVRTLRTCARVCAHVSRHRSTHTHTTRTELTVLTTRSTPRHTLATRSPRPRHARPGRHARHPRCLGRRLERRLRPRELAASARVRRCAPLALIGRERPTNPSARARLQWPVRWSHHMAALRSRRQRLRVGRTHRGVGH